MRYIAYKVDTMDIDKVIDWLMELHQKDPYALKVERRMLKKAKSHKCSREWRSFRSQIASAMTNKWNDDRDNFLRKIKKGDKIVMKKWKKI